MFPVTEPPIIIDENSSGSEFKVKVPVFEKFPLIVTEPVFSIVKLLPEATVIFWACNVKDIRVVNSINFLIVYYLSEINFSTNFSNLEILSSCSLSALISTGTSPW